MFTDEQHEVLSTALDDYVQGLRDRAKYADGDEQDIEVVIETAEAIQAKLTSAREGVAVVDCDGDTEFFERAEDAIAYADARNEAEGTDIYEAETQWPGAWPPEGIHDPEDAASMIAALQDDEDDDE